MRFFSRFSNKFFRFFGETQENLCWFFRPKQGGIVVVTGYNDIMRSSHGLALLWLILVWDGEPFCIDVVAHVGISDFYERMSLY